jgi:hypothetical protein
MMASAMRGAAVALLLVVVAGGDARAAGPCRKVVLEGEARAGQEWKAPIGGGWVFRVMPIGPAQAGYSGWDLVVDRETGAGFPDALYVATPPYNSINEREVGTTFGLRAQDAIGWNPRSFRFLTDGAAFKEAQRDYDLAFAHPKDPGAGTEEAAARLLRLAERAAQGEFRVVDARITPGVADPRPFAENWAREAARMQHEEDPPASGRATATGALNWIRFRIVLWLPAGWALPPGVPATAAVCGQ